MSDGPLYLVVRSEPADAGDRAHFEQWYAEHLQRLLAVPGVRSGRFFEAEQGEPRYMAMFELDGPEVFESEAYRSSGKLADLPYAVEFTRNVYRPFATPAGTTKTKEVT